MFAAVVAIEPIDHGVKVGRLAGVLGELDSLRLVSYAMIGATNMELRRYNAY